MLAVDIYRIVEFFCTKHRSLILLGRRKLLNLLVRESCDVVWGGGGWRRGERSYPPPLLVDRIMLVLSMLIQATEMSRIVIAYPRTVYNVWTEYTCRDDPCY